MKTRYGGLLAALVLGAATLTQPQAVSQEVMHARVSFSGGGAMVKGAADADWSYATMNTLVLPGDTLWVDKGGMTELEMAGGTFLRMADGSKAEIVSLPPSASVRGWTGACYVQRIHRSTGDFVFETPACTVQVEENTQVRFDVVDEGATTVSVRWGRATVQSQAGGESVDMFDGRRVYVDLGCLPSMPVLFDRSVEDSFDAWNRERASGLVLGSTSLPGPVAEKAHVIGVYDLAPYGEWVYVDHTPYWRPTVVVDYVPYRVGYWSYVPACGYVWVGDYPFGYVTSHYGRWTHHASYGWLWTYTDVWGPAWVSTIHYGPNFVWCPLDPWDRPVFFGDAFYTVGGVHFSVFASSYCHVSSLLIGPAPVFSCTQTVFVGVPDTEIHIWNIYVNGPDRHVSPGNIHALFPNGSPLEVRDYFPRRSIRGLDTIGGDGRRASARIAKLETEEGRPQFTTVRRPAEHTVRTSSMRVGRTARLRSVTAEPPSGETLVPRRDAGVRVPSDRGRDATNAASPRTRRAVPGSGRAARTDDAAAGTDTTRRVVTEPRTRTLDSGSQRDVRRPASPWAPSASSQEDKSGRDASRRVITEPIPRTPTPAAEERAPQLSRSRSRTLVVGPDSVRTEEGGGAAPEPTPTLPDTPAASERLRRTRVISTTPTGSESPGEVVPSAEPSRSRRVTIPFSSSRQSEPERTSVRVRQMESPSGARPVQDFPQPTREVFRPAPPEYRAVRQQIIQPPEPIRPQRPSENSGRSVQAPSGPTRDAGARSRRVR